MSTGRRLSGSPTSTCPRASIAVSHPPAPWIENKEEWRRKKKNGEDNGSLQLLSHSISLFLVHKWEEQRLA